MRVSRLARLLGGAAITGFVIFLAVALPQALSRAATMLIAADHNRGETADAAQARFMGPDYVGAIAAIREALPPDESYLLVEGGRPQDGNLYWVRFDLAPRRPLYLGRLAEMTDVRRLRQRLPGKVHEVIVAYGPGEAPQLFERYRFVAELQRRASATAPQP